MQTFKRQYGSIGTITIPTWATDASNLSFNDASFATSNVSLIPLGGSAAFPDTVPTSELSGYVDLTLTATELRTPRIAGYYFKTGVLTMPFVVETVGHPSAMHPYESIPLPASGNLQGGSAGTIQLPTTASATTNLYAGSSWIITEGTGVGQIRSIVSYDGATKIATNEPDWTVTPDSASTGYIVPVPPAEDTTLADVNVAQISLDATAANNLEAAFDGTGYDSKITVLGATTDLTDVTSALSDYLESGVSVHPGSEVSANLQKINDTTLQGVGTSADSWRPA